MRQFLMMAAVTVACFAAPVAGQVVQLRSGKVLVGKIEQADEGGLTLRRFDNGGVLELTWDQLSTYSADRIKESSGLAGDEEGEVMVSAERFRYELGGGGSDEVTGRIVDQDDTTITVRRLGVNYPIKRQAIRGRTTVEVPATSVYTKDEYYNETVNEVAPGDDADKHIEVADLLTRVRDYDRAQTHLEKASELGGGRQPNLLAGKIDKLALFRESARERDHLDKIKIALAREDFQKGVELIEAFEDKYPKSKLRNEFLRIQERFSGARERKLINRVTEIWYKTAYALARKKATEPGVTFDAAREYAESTMGQEIRARAQKLLEIELDEVEALWEQRLEGRSGPRAQRYSYGVGSWTLGSQAILKDTVQSKATEVEEESKEQQERRRAEDRIRRALERQRRAATRQGANKKNEATPEVWWENASADERMVWLRAYYAEFGGDLQVENAHLNACVTCAGEGRLTVFAQSGQAQKAECPTCHGTRYRRWIRAR